MINLNTSGSFHPGCIVIKEEIEFTDLILDEDGEVEVYTPPSLKIEPECDQKNYAEKGKPDIHSCSVILHRGVNCEELSSCMRCQKIFRHRDAKKKNFNCGENDPGQSEISVPGSAKMPKTKLKDKSISSRGAIPGRLKNSKGFSSAAKCQKVLKIQDTEPYRPGPKSKRNIRAPRRCVGCDCENKVPVPDFNAKEKSDSVASFSSDNRSRGSATKYTSKVSQWKSVKVPKEAPDELVGSKPENQTILQKFTNQELKSQKSPKNLPRRKYKKRALGKKSKSETLTEDDITSQCQPLSSKVPILGTEPQIEAEVLSSSNSQPSKLVSEKPIGNSQCQSEAPITNPEESNDAIIDKISGNELMVKIDENKQCQPAVPNAEEPIPSTSNAKLNPCSVVLQKLINIDLNVSCQKVPNNEKPQNAKPDKNYKCDKCQTNYKDKNLLLRHYRRSHQIQCPECQKTFTSKFNLTVHLRRHTGERPFKCDQCQKAFTYKKNLQFHMRSGTCMERFMCPRCPKGFTRKAFLIEHSRVEHNETPYKCEKCQRYFEKESKLTRHLRVHSSEKPYICSKCPMRFRWKNNLKNHMELHEGKEYICNECQKVFHSRYNLLVHTKAHRDGFPFKCYICKKCFVTKKSLKSHMFVHRTYFKCNKCHKVFARKKPLVDHFQYCK